MAKRQIYIRRKISMYGRSSSIKLDVASSTGFINHFSNIRCLDAIDEQSVFKVFHVEPEKLQLETLKFQKAANFCFNKNGALCASMDSSLTYSISSKTIEEALTYIGEKLQSAKSYAPYDIVIPPKTWWGYKNTIELEDYAREIGGHIADITEWALWVTQRLQDGETLKQLNAQWINRDWQWIVKDGSEYLCIGGSVIDFNPGSEFTDGKPKNYHIHNFRCAVPLVVVPVGKISKSNCSEKKLTIEITYQNGGKEKISNVKKYIVYDKDVLQPDFTFLPFATESISVNPENIKFEMFDNLFLIDDPEELQFMSDLAMYVNLVKAFPQAGFSKQFKLVFPDRMHNTNNPYYSPSLMVSDAINEVKNIKGMAGKMHLLVLGAEMISQGRNWKEVFNFEIKSRWSKFIYIDCYSYNDNFHTAYVGDCDFTDKFTNKICSSKDHNLIEARKLLFCSDNRHRYSILDGTLKNAFSKKAADSSYVSSNMVPILVE